MKRITQHQRKATSCAGAGRAAESAGGGGQALHSPGSTRCSSWRRTCPECRPAGPLLSQPAPASRTHCPDKKPALRRIRTPPAARSAVGPCLANSRTNCVTDQGGEPQLADSWLPLPNLIWFWSPASQTADPDDKSGFPSRVQVQRVPEVRGSGPLRPIARLNGDGNNPLQYFHRKDPSPFLVHPPSLLEAALHPSGVSDSTMLIKQTAQRAAALIGGGLECSTSGRLLGVAAARYSTATAQSISGGYGREWDAGCEGNCTAAATPPPPMSVLLGSSSPHFHVLLQRPSRSRLRCVTTLGP